MQEFAAQKEALHDKMLHERDLTLAETRARQVFPGPRAPCHTQQPASTALGRRQQASGARPRERTRARGHGGDGEGGGWGGVRVVWWGGGVRVV